MKLADLVVGIGANTKQLEKGLGKAMREMKYFGRNTKALGKTLSMSITAPLAIMGATSVQAFRVQAKAIAQVEAGLKSTGNQVGYTSKQLQQMASDLQSKTLFGDEQILKDATAQLLTFTNISGDNFARTQQAALDLATRLDGDLKGASIQLGKALNDPVANLSALSRSGIQFSDEQKEVIKSMAETGRLAEAQTLILDELNKQYGGSAEAAAEADGGFTQLANAFGDLQEEIGRTLVPILTPLVQKLREVVETFQGASDGTKRFIVVMGLIAGAIGPVLVILPTLIGGIKAARTAMLDFNKSVLLNPYVAAAAALGFLAYTVYQYTRSTTDANRAQKEFDASLKDAQKETARQMVKVDLLATAYNSANTSIEEKKEALEELKKISPEYFGNLDAEKTSYDDLKTAIDAYNKSLLKKATAAAMEKRLQAMAEERIDLMDAVISKESEVAKLREAAANGDKYAADSLRKIWNPALKQSQENLANHDKAMQEFADMMIQSVPVVEEETNAVTGNTKATKTNRQTREELLATMKAQLVEQRRVIEAEKEYRDLLREDILANQPETPGAKVAALPDELTGLETIPDMMDTFEEDFIVDEIAFEKWQKWNNVMQGFKSVGEAVFQSLAMNAASFGNEMGQAFGAMARGAEDGKERMKEATRGIINQALAAAQATIIEAMISSGKFTGPAAPVIIPALVAGGIGLVQSLFSDIPAFADGGIISGPTVGLMGEYPGAKTNPEVIAPLDKLQGMLGAAPVVVTGKIAGNDIRLSNQRSERNAQRFLR